ncbi:unnamed protein product [Macrosiphum euphorbiae]|uniref:Uncharacterized protein n=1 Tax=Macrosiphum euphorbiae TaxID=13131 RepID=A0AAV0W381_9HEMI|nr:unnamed protein product [Macrosiphum euphorbiae]
MYGRTDEYYIREASRNPNSYLYKKICTSGPVTTFRLLAEQSFDLGSVTVNKLEPADSVWTEKITKPGDSNATQTSTPQTKETQPCTSSSRRPNSLFYIEW